MHYVRFLEVDFSYAFLSNASYSHFLDLRFSLISQGIGSSVIIIIIGSSVIITPRIHPATPIPTLWPPMQKEIIPTPVLIHPHWVSETSVRTSEKDEWEISERWVISVGMSERSITDNQSSSWSYQVVYFILSYNCFVKINDYFC